jgi:hypothetical protein
LEDLYQDYKDEGLMIITLITENYDGEAPDTDDLNDGKNRGGKDIKNDLHYSAEGYKTLGKRFAESALNLIKQ